MRAYWRQTEVSILILLRPLVFETRSGAVLSYLSLAALERIELSPKVSKAPALPLR